MILAVFFEVFRKLVYSSCEDGDLDFRRPGVIIRTLVIPDYLAFGFLRQHTNLTTFPLFLSAILMPAQQTFLPTL